jgi:putative colanic acid biosynthesis UDP-glucose lipid carrier transferase
MNTLAAAYRPEGTELPLVALVRLLIAPVACVAGLVLCMLAYGEPLAWRYPILATVAFFVAARVFGELPLTNGGTFLLPSRAIVTAWVTVVGVLLLLGFVTQFSGLYSRKVTLTWIALTPFLIHGLQELARRALHRFVAGSAAARSKVIVGVDAAGRRLARHIAADPCRGVVRGYFDDRYGDRLEGVKPGEVLGGLADVAPYLKQHGVQVVYITLPMSRDPRIARLLDELRDTTASIYFVPHAAFDPIQARVDRVGDVPVVAMCETPFYGINGALKRATDVALAGLALALAWPVMLVAAIGVKWSSPGPVLFRQRRYGLDGKEFLVYKFRTMTVCEDGDRIVQAQRNDRRVTAFGAFLRRTSIDELPQLFNVLGGSMSIVGPRPHAVAHNEEYRRRIDGYMLRHKVRPGITGWAQVNGCRGETGTVSRMEERIRYDIDYLKHWSLSLDLWICFRTLVVVLRDRKAY